MPKYQAGGVVPKPSLQIRTDLLRECIDATNAIEQVRLEIVALEKKRQELTQKRTQAEKAFHSECPNAPGLFVYNDEELGAFQVNTFNDDLEIVPTTIVRSQAARSLTMRSLTIAFSNAGLKFEYGTGINGNTHRGYIHETKGQDMDKVNRVLIDLGFDLFKYEFNPILRRLDFHFTGNFYGLNVIL